MRDSSGRQKAMRSAPCLSPLPQPKAETNELPTSGRNLLKASQEDAEKSEKSDSGSNPPVIFPETTSGTDIDSVVQEHPNPPVAPPRLSDNAICTVSSTSLASSGASREYPSKSQPGATPKSNRLTSTRHSTSNGLLTAYSKIMTPPLRFRCPRNLRMLCRLVAVHSRTHTPEGSIIRFSVGTEPYAFKVRLMLDIGRNVRCLVFTRQIGWIRCESEKKGGSSLSFPENDVIFAFNWFSPRAIWDYISLGLKLTTGQNIEQVFGMCNGASFEHAQQFMQMQALRDFIFELKLGYIPEKMSPAQNAANRSEAAALGLHSELIHCRKVTLTGFSMGGSTAHAMAVLLKEVQQIPQEIRVFGMASPRPGNEKLEEWFEQNCTPDSLNLALCMRREYLAAPPGSTSFGGCNGVGWAAANSQCAFSISGSHQQSSSSSSSSSSGASELGPPPYGTHVPRLSVLVYDPVMLKPSCAKGFGVHPRLHVMEKGCGGFVQLMAAQERERLRYADMQGVDANPTDEEDGSRWLRQHIGGRAHDELHQVLTYYEEMTGLTNV